MTRPELDVYLDADDLADALRADVAAGLTADAEVAAAEVVLRRAGQRAVRGDHPAAGVLPDPGRAGDPAAPRRRDRPDHPARRRWSSWAPARRRRPGCCSTRCTRTARSARSCRSTCRRPRAARRRRASPRTIPGCTCTAIVGDFTRHLGQLPPAGPAGRLPRRHDRQPRPDGARPFLAGAARRARTGRLAAARHRPGEGPRACWSPPTTTRPGSPPSSTATCCGCSTGSWAPTSTLDAFAPRRAVGRRRGVDRDAAARPRARCGYGSPALDLTVDFAAGEELRTEVSAKFRRDGVDRELAAAGFAPRHWWTDPAGRFAVTLARATS